MNQITENGKRLGLFLSLYGLYKKVCAQMQHSYEGKCHKHGHFGLSNHSAALTANIFESGPMPTP